MAGKRTASEAGLDEPPGQRQRQEAEDAQDECPVCREPLGDESVAAHPAEQAQREHRFHKRCLARSWWDERGDNWYRCPECRVRCPSPVHVPLMREMYPDCILCHQALVVGETSPANEDINDCHHEGHLDCWEDLVRNTPAHQPVRCPVCGDDVSAWRQHLPPVDDTEDDDEDQDEAQDAPPATVEAGLDEDEDAALAARNPVIPGFAHVPLWMRVRLNNALIRAMDAALVPEAPNWLRFEMITLALRMYFPNN